MKQAKVDRWLGLVFIVGGMVWSLVARFTITGAYEPAVAGPQVFPLLLGLLLALLGLVLLAKGFFSGSRAQADAASEIETPSWHEVRVVVSTFGLLIVYGFLLEKVGFLVATPIVVAATFVGILGITSWRQVLAMTLGLTFGSYIVFALLVGTYLPHGSWWQALNF